MLLLISTTDKLQLVTSAAATVDVVASYMDSDNANPPVVQGDTMNTQLTAITTATTTDIVAAPASNERRNVKTIHIRNKHATTATDVTVMFDRSATDYELHKANLLPGEALEYVEGIGFFKLAGVATDGLQYVRKGSDQTFSSTSLADVTGMGFSVSANAVYEFEYEIIWQSATLTVGARLAVNGPASPTSVQGTTTMYGGVAATTGAPAAFAEFAFSGFTAYDTGPTMASIQPINSNLVARMAVLIEVGGTAGTVIPRWNSETATNTVVKAGSYGTCKRLA